MYTSTSYSLFSACSPRTHSRHIHCIQYTLIITYLHVGEKLSLAEEELVQHRLVAAPGLKSSSPRISSCRGAADRAFRVAMSVVGAWTIAHSSTSSASSTKVYISICSSACKPLVVLGGTSRPGQQGVRWQSVSKVVECVLVSALGFKMVARYTCAACTHSWSFLFKNRYYRNK